MKTLSEMSRAEIIQLGVKAAQQDIHDCAVAHGFWEPGANRNDAEMLMLIVSELGEALEGLRHGNPQSDHIPEFSAAEEELADAVIRICDMATGRNWRLAEAITAKMKFNESRPYKHGKRF